jgi:hypothetical protein
VGREYEGALHGVGAAAPWNVLEVLERRGDGWWFVRVLPSGESALGVSVNTSNCANDHPQFRTCIVPSEFLDKMSRKDRLADTPARVGLSAKKMVPF